MITIYNAGGLKIEANRGTWNSSSSVLSAYAGERTFLRVTATNTTTAAQIALRFGYAAVTEFGADFDCVSIAANTYEVDIDVTDIVRIATSNMLVKIYDKNNADAQRGELDCYLAQDAFRIDINQLYIPAHASALDVQLPSEVIVTSPYSPISFACVKQNTQLYAKKNNGQYAALTGNVVSDVYASAGDVYSIATKSGDVYTEVQRVIAKSASCGVRTCLVTWKDRLGITNSAVMYASKFNEGVTKTTEFATIDNSYIQRKSSEYGCVLWLDSLTPYDYWVYAAIITSDEVTVDGNSVEVATKNASVPDGKEFTKIEIEINYKRYDEI